MTPLTELIIISGAANRLLSAGQLERLPGGSNYRRYVQFNRALKAGELLQVRRGLYLLSNDYRIEYHSSVGWVSDSVTRHITFGIASKHINDFKSFVKLITAFNLKSGKAGTLGNQFF